jgi:hypothetical protein
MGFSRGPKIVTDGLVQMLDAANTKSYIGSGTSWDNLVSSDSFILLASPTFSDTFNGTITFASASSQRASGSGTFIEENFINNQNFTIGAFIKPTANSVGGNSRSAVYANQRYSSEAGPGGFGLNIISNHYGLSLTAEDSGGGGGSTDATSFQAQAQIDIVADVPQYITYTWDNSGPTIKGYFNGVLEETSTSATYQWTTSSVSPQPNPPRLAQSTQGGWGNYFGADYYHYHLYNKALTADEILQNYNALKSRFNL